MKGRAFMSKRKIHIKPAGWITIILLPIIIIGIYFSYGYLKKYSIIPSETYTNEDFNIKAYISKVDKDGDGIDDQTDILENVRAYIATNPKYKSKYYASGYPDDEYGVCTDVVAQGLLGAGYDLMTLVEEDRYKHPEDYADEPIDKNIDFRRVRNLLIYFRRHALSLTTDLNEIAEWQGGDIVVFQGHIGIISDKRNKDGIPLLIHNGSPLQIGYEQNVMALKEREIVAHFRIS